MPIMKLTCDWLGLLAWLTVTRPGAWRERNGPRSGVGLDYWYENAARRFLANINLDQGVVTVEITDQHGAEVSLYKADCTRDALLGQHIKVVARKGPPLQNATRTRQP